MVPPGLIQHLFRTPVIENRQGRAVLGNLIQAIENVPLALLPSDDGFQPVLQGVDYRLRLAFTGQGCEIGGKLLSVTIADVERHYFDT